MMSTDIARVPAQPVEDLPVYDAEALTRGEGRALIVLKGQTYVLRITRQGKLILTK